MDWLIANWRAYVWVPSGEVIRGVEVTFLGAFLQALVAWDPGTAVEPSVWFRAALVGAGVAALEYLKGKVPPAGGSV